MHSLMHSILGAGNRSATVASRSSTCSLNRRVCAPHGTSHSHMAQCFEGLPDLPGAPQGYGRPTSNTLLSRFAPARRPDQCEGQLGSYPSRLTLCGGVCPKAGTRRCMPSGHMISREMHAFSAYDLKECVCPKAGTQRCMPSRHMISRCMPSRHMISDGVCPRAVTRRGNSRRSRAVTPSRCMPDGSDTSDEDRDLDPDPDLLIFVPACRGLVPVLVSS